MATDETNNPLPHVEDLEIPAIKFNWVEMGLRSLNLAVLALWPGDGEEDRLMTAFPEVYTVLGEAYPVPMWAFEYASDNAPFCDARVRNGRFGHFVQACRRLGVRYRIVQPVPEDCGPKDVRYTANACDWTWSPAMYQVWVDGFDEDAGHAGRPVVHFADDPDTDYLLLFIDPYGFDEPNNRWAFAVRLSDVYEDREVTLEPDDEPVDLDPDVAALLDQLEDAAADGDFDAPFEISLDGDPSD